MNGRRAVSGSRALWPIGQKTRPVTWSVVRVRSSTGTLSKIHGSRTLVQHFAVLSYGHIGALVITDLWKKGKIKSSVLKVSGECT